LEKNFVITSKVERERKDWLEKCSHKWEKLTACSERGERGGMDTRGKERTRRGQVQPGTDTSILREPFKNGMSVKDTEVGYQATTTRRERKTIRGEHGEKGHSQKYVFIQQLLWKRVHQEEKIQVLEEKSNCKKAEEEVAEMIERLRRHNLCRREKNKTI